MSRVLLILTGVFYASLSIAESGLEELQNSSSGTCFFVDAFGTAVTNNHVVADAEKITVIAANGSSSPAIITKVSENLDLALLSTGLQTPHFLSLAPIDSLTLGQEVFTIGYPATNILGDKPKYSEGAISALTGLNNDDSWIQMSTPIQPGNSGGPLVNFKGQVVGIVTATAAVENFLSETGSLPQNVNWAVKADYAAAMIPRAANDIQLSNRTKAISHTERSICRVLKFGKNNNLNNTLDRFSTEKARLSYAVGWDIGADILRRKGQFDFEQITTAITDITTNSPPKVEPSIMRKLLTALQERVRNEQSGLTVPRGPRSEMPDLSYAVGWDIGADIQRRTTEFDVELIVLGMRDIYHGLDPKVSIDEMRRLLTIQQDKVRQEQRVASSSLASQNVAEGRAFLARNLQRKNVIVLPSGIQYEVIEKGRGRKPKLKDNVLVHYRGSTLDGREFDSSFARNVPEQFQISKTITAWQEVIPLMRTGATWKIFTPGEYAFGAQGNGPIGPNETLVFDIYLVKIN